LGEIERGKGNPTIKTLSNIGKALDIPLPQLFDASTPPPSKTRTLSDREVAQIEGAVQVLTALFGRTARRGRVKP
jgi:transcriptional regulator with XRE-family HTH domain